MSATAVLVFMRTAVLSGFDSVPGGLGDGRFNLAVLEHWYRVVLGAESWRSPNWFYPVPGVLGMSDALVLLAPPYVLGRLAGLHPVAALGATQAFAAMVGMAGTLVFLRRLLGLVWPAATAGAVAFGLSSALYATIAGGQVQLLAVELVPWVAVTALLTLRHPDPRWPAAMALLLAGLLSTSFYVGWFAGLDVLFLIGLALPAAAGALPGWVAERKPGLIIAGTLLVVGLVPFAVLYGPIALGAAPRPWSVVALTLPGPFQLFEARDNALWGPVGEALQPGLAHRGGELGKGLSWGLTALFLVTFARLSLGWQPSLGPATRRLALVLGAGVLASWLLMLDIGGVSLWTVIYRWVPGGTTIRSVFRFNLILAFPVVAVAAIGLDQLWRQTSNAPRHRLAVAALTALVMIEQLNLAPTVLSRTRDFGAVESQRPAPATCRSFVLLGATPDPSLHRWSRQTVALMIAQAQGVPTLNGYSGMAPPGWKLFDPTDHTNYRRAIVTWADAQNIWPGLCGLDPEQQRWFPVLRTDLTPE